MRRPFPFLLLFVVGCLGSDPAETLPCTPGESEVCSCPSGLPSQAICTASRVFTECLCEASPVGDAAAGGGGDASLPSGGAGGASLLGGMGGSQLPAGSGGGTQTGGSGAAGGIAGMSGTGGMAGMGGASADPAVTSHVLAARHLVSDRPRKRLYVTTGGDAPTYANSLVVLDAATGNVITSVSIGSDPNSLALTEDGSTLWVGIDGAFSLRKIDLSSGNPVPGATYTLPRGAYGDLGAAGPIVPLPGGATSVAVSLHRFGVSPSFAGAVVIDDGVGRMKKTLDHTGASRLTSGPAGFLFGYNNLHTGYEFYVLRVTAAGLEQTEHEDLINGFSTDITYADGFVYATSGEVVDVRQPAQPVPAGKFSYQGLVLPLAPERVLMLSPRGSFSDEAPACTLRLLDRTTFTQSKFQTLDAVARGTLVDFVQAGDDSVAFIGGDGFSSSSDARKIYIVRTSLLR